jgi:hypothetical protein
VCSPQIQAGSLCYFEPRHPARGRLQRSMGFLPVGRVACSLQIQAGSLCYFEPRHPARGRLQRSLGFLPVGRVACSPQIQAGSLCYFEPRHPAKGRLQRSMGFLPVGRVVCSPQIQAGSLCYFGPRQCAIGAPAEEHRLPASRIRIRESSLETCDAGRAGARAYRRANRDGSPTSSFACVVLRSSFGLTSERRFS